VDRTKTLSKMKLCLCFI